MSEETLAATIKYGPIRCIYGWVGSEGRWRRVKVGIVYRQRGILDVGRRNLTEQGERWLVATVSQQTGQGDAGGDQGGS